MDSSTTTFSDQSVFNSSMFDWLVFIITVLCVIEIPVFNANSADPDQTPHYAASDLGMHYLPVTLLGVS